MHWLNEGPTVTDLKSIACSLLLIEQEPEIQALIEHLEAERHLQYDEVCE
jgi:hypothetical protein